MTSWIAFIERSVPTGPRLLGPYDRPVEQIIGACSLDCPDACSWVVTVEDGRAVKLRGNPDHPFTRGGLCVKVNPYIEYTNRPDRILHPLRRVAPKGAGTFHPISWDEALAEIGGRMREAIDVHGGEAIWPYAGTGSVGWLQGEPAGKRLFNALGASNHLLNICSLAGRVGMSYTIGSPFGMDPMDLVQSKLILLWGTNTLTSNHHLWPFVERARGRGAQVVVIDPYRTATAARADHHVAPLPGTDGALALGLVAEIVRLGAQDDAYLAEHTLGWERFVGEELSTWSAERAAATCDLPVDDVRALAARIATSRPTGIRSLMGMQRHGGGGQAARVMSMIPAVTGDFARLGGGICYSTGSAYGFDVEAATRPDLRPHPVRTLTMTRLGEGLLDVDDPPVTVLFMWAANPLAANPDLGRVRRGLARDDLFTVVVDHVHTPTTAYADIVLPGTTQLEHAELQDSYSHLYVQWNEPAVAPRGEALAHTEIFRRLARVLGLTDPALFASDDDLAAALLGSADPALAGITLERLKERGWLRLDLPEPCLPVVERFPTPSGRFEFASERAEADAHGLLPHYVAPFEASDPGDGVSLVSPANHHLLNTTFAGSLNHTKAGEPRITIHPDDAARFGVADGEMVSVFNDRGSFAAAVSVSTAARPRVAHTTKGTSEVNATVAERDADMGRGAVYHDNRVWLVPVPD